MTPPRDIDPAVAEMVVTIRDRFGISGMRERALLVDGRLTIRSLPERGTEVVLDVPARAEET